MSRITWLYTGAVVPEAPEFRNQAYSAAGQSAQRNVLSALAQAGLPPDEIISVAPSPSFPKDRRVWVEGGSATLDESLPAAVLVGHCNVRPLKELTIGLAVGARILKWGWRGRHRSGRVVVIYNLYVPPGLICWMAARLARAKFIPILYDIGVPGESAPSTIDHRLAYRMIKWLLPRVDGMIPITDAIPRDFGFIGPYHRLDGGLTLKATGSERVGQKDSKIQGVTLGYAGALHIPNGVELLLDAFALLVGDKYRLKIAGSGPLEERVREACRRDGRIEFKGMLRSGEMSEFYEDVDVLVNPRLTESINTRYFFPSKVLEYLATGKRVITTCSGHMEAEYGRFVTLLKPETPDELAKCIGEISKSGDAERVKNSADLREYLRSEKTWEAQGRSIRAYLEAIAVRQGGAKTRRLLMHGSRGR